MVTRNYYYDKKTKTIFYTNIQVAELAFLQHLGESDNPNPKMAAAIFGKGLTGCKIREYNIN